MKTKLSLSILLTCATFALAAHAPHEPTATSTEPHATETLHYTHPDLPPPGITWPGVMLIVAGGMFLAAMVIGPIVRANTPEEIPTAHSHDEPLGASGHHGHGGEIAPTPDHTAHGHP